MAQELRLELGCKCIVRGQVGQVEQRTVEPGVVPVDEPETRAVIDEIGGEQIVVAKDDRNRSDGALKLPGLPGQRVECHGERALAPRFEQAQVLSNDLEHPEDQ